MACSASITQTAACTSGIGKETDKILLWQLVAQATANWLVALTPGTEVTPAAIYARACTSGVAKLTDPIQLRRLIAQNLCNQIT